MNAGAWERFRRDKDKFPDSALGRALDGWPGERWLDIRRIGVLGPIMKARIARCARKGFDAVEPDNIDGYRTRAASRSPGATSFATTAGSRATRTGGHVRRAQERPRPGEGARPRLRLRDRRGVLPVPGVRQARFPSSPRARPVLEVEYKLDRSDFCSKAQALGFSSMKKRLSLGPWRRAC